ncbi:hypothetical protein COU54_03805 [Candidatus Pacearchaeota archaeon CG10_big_fil_rev_8_21_14_0_10_31_24]|nr:MAG: hypothetical protein COU54_03805 [Candidatus Pacearchaeota archaeon CG10_big_fil_rev_8_21_14_0_10_31_24]
MTNQYTNTERESPISKGAKATYNALGLKGIAGGLVGLALGGPIGLVAGAAIGKYTTWNGTKKALKGTLETVANAVDIYESAKAYESLDPTARYQPRGQNPSFTTPQVNIENFEMPQRPTAPSYSLSDTKRDKIKKDWEYVQEKFKFAQEVAEESERVLANRINIGLKFAKEGIVYGAKKAAYEISNKTGSITSTLTNANRFKKLRSLTSKASEELGRDITPKDIFNKKANDAARKAEREYLREMSARVITLKHATKARPNDDELLNNFLRELEQYEIRRAAYMGEEPREFDINSR